MLGCGGGVGVVLPLCGVVLGLRCRLVSIDRGFIVRRLRLFGLLVVALSALGAVVSSAAFGVTMVLPSFSALTSGTSSSGPGTLFGATEIKCRRDKDLFGAVSKSLGTYDITLEECRTLGSNCRSLGQAVGSGSIVSTGEYHLVLETLGGRDLRLIWFLVSALHVECEILGTTLIVLSGNVLGSIEATGTNRKEFLFHVRATRTAQEITSYENDSGTLVAAGGLLAAVNEGTARASFEEMGTDVMFTERATVLEN